MHLVFLRSCKSLTKPSTSLRRWTKFWVEKSMSSSTRDRHASPETTMDTMIIIASLLIAPHLPLHLPRAAGPPGTLPSPQAQAARPPPAQAVHPPLAAVPPATSLVTNHAQSLVTSLLTSPTANTAPIFPTSSPCPIPLPHVAATKVPS